MPDTPIPAFIPVHLYAPSRDKRKRPVPDRRERDLPPPEGEDRREGPQNRRVADRRGAQRDYRAIALAAAPVAPQCVASRDSWVEYLASAAAHVRADHGHSPFLFGAKDEPPRFNRQFDMCRDCTRAHELAMTRAGKCNKGYLASLPDVAPTPAPEPLS